MGALRGVPLGSRSRCVASERVRASLKRPSWVTAEQTPHEAGGSAAAIRLRQMFPAVTRVGASRSHSPVPLGPGLRWSPTGRGGAVRAARPFSFPLRDRAAPAVTSRGDGNTRGTEPRRAAGAPFPSGEMRDPPPRKVRTAPGAQPGCGFAGVGRVAAEPSPAGLSQRPGSPRGSHCGWAARSGGAEPRLMRDPSPTTPAPRGAARRPALAPSAGEKRSRHFTPCGKSFEPLPCHAAFSYLFARWLLHAELARMTFPAQLPSCFRLFYQQIQLENGYHLAEKQTEKHIFVSKTLMIGRIAPISA